MDSGLVRLGLAWREAAAIANIADIRGSLEHAVCIERTVRRTCAKQGTVSEIRRSEFVRRLSSVGWGARESIQVMLGRLVTDVREGVVRQKFTDDELDEVIAFHDRAERLWQEAIATDPPLDRRAMTGKLRDLLETCRTPVLGEFERRLERGVRLAEEFEAQD